MQSKNPGSANPIKAYDRTDKKRPFKSGTSFDDCDRETHPRTRAILNRFKVPRFFVVALLNIAMLFVVNGHSIRSAYVNKDSSSDDGTFTTKVIDSVQHFQHEDLTIHEEEQQSEAKDAFVVNYNEDIETPNFTQKSTINRQLNHICSKFTNHILCALNECTWTRKDGCVFHPVPPTRNPTPVPSIPPTLFNANSGSDCLALTDKNKCATKG
eukprot:5736905-Ditylum_brightwellii.AAC.1